MKKETAKSFSGCAVYKSFFRLAFALTALILPGLRAEAQSVSENWEVAYQPTDFRNAHPYALVVDSAGNVIVGGDSADLPVGSNCIAERCQSLTIKYDSNGNTVWRNWLSSSLITNGRVQALAVDAANDVFVLSQLQTAATGAPEVALVKYNAAGKRQWFCYSSRYNAVALAVTPEGEAYTFMSIVVPNPPLGEALELLITKLDVNGNELWKQLGGGGPLSSISNVRGVTLRLDGLGNVYTAVVATDLGGGYINRYDRNGNLLNNIGVGTLSDMNAYRVDAAGNSYVLGTALFTQDRIVEKFTPTGTLVWVNDMGPKVAEHNDNLKDLGVDSAGEVFVLQDLPSVPATSTGQDMVIMKFSPSGTREWTEHFNTSSDHTIPEVSRAMVVSETGDSYITGDEPSQLGTPQERLAVTARFNSSGTKIWNVEKGSELFDFGAVPVAIAIALGTNGHVFTEGVLSQGWLTIDWQQK